MKRLPGWEIRLEQIMRRGRTSPFKWGVHDCCLFAADCVWAMTGYDPGDWFRGRYKNEQEAFVALRQYTNGEGVEKMMEILALNIGWQDIEPAFAQRGDVSLVELDDGPGLGVIDGEGMIAYAARPSGLGLLPVDFGTRAWRIL